MKDLKEKEKNTFELLDGLDAELLDKVIKLIDDRFDIFLSDIVHHCEHLQKDLIGQVRYEQFWNCEHLHKMIDDSRK